MNRFASPLIRLIDRVAPPETVSAHCDIPCGIYDPHAAQIAALTVLRMNQLIAGLEMAGTDKESMDKYGNSISRYIKAKEEHAELCKKEIDILWHDYFRPEHVEKYPDLHTKIWNVNKLASRNKQNADVAAAEELLAAVREIAQIFWETKGVATRVAGSNQAVGGELVYVS
ncbi:MAG TPA: superoxide dismutase, Ni [Dehalococcoidia bacterium]|nr:superoxide dismutase, Ni [Dehalococcoidia bacterium]